MTKPLVLAIAGATASGKSELAMKIAQERNGEIICMDSMQIYRRMNIGTAKPTDEEQRQIPHHMLDILEPTENYAVADYACEAERVILEVISRGKLPVLTGGTGLYLKALMHGLSLGGAGGDEIVRKRLNDMALEVDGKTRLHQMLLQVDPVSAQKFHPNDVRRVVRALEVYELTGTPISSQKPEEAERPFRILPFAIDIPREELYRRLTKRVHLMMNAGLLDEVKALLESGVTADRQSMQGIGYKELIPVIVQKANLQDAVSQIILNTRHYAKRQGTWMRTEPKTIWLHQIGEERLQEALQHIEDFVQTQEEE